MNKDMNKLLREMKKYEIGSGLLISLVMGLSYSFLNALIYFLGISVGFLNFYASYFVIDKLFGRSKSETLILLITLFRITLIAILGVAFMNDMEKMIFYAAGVISHYILFTICALKNRKGSV